MPSYDYFCQNCDKEFEVFHSITTKLEECPHCQAKDPERLISQGTAFVLQGSGWSRDNYSK